MAALRAGASSTVALGNGKAAALGDVPVLDFPDFHEVLVGGVEAGARVAALFGTPRPSASVRLIAVLALGQKSELRLAATDVYAMFPSVTPALPQVHLFEREIAEQWGVEPMGHPWLKPLRFHAPYVEPVLSHARVSGASPPPSTTAGATRFFQMEGEEVHEVAVGPVHAGVIEPGHFRFQAHGETVHHLEISLGYQHRGVERSLKGGPGPRTAHVMETLAGDTTVAHATAYAQAVEALGGTAAPPRALWLRGVALELERMANHVGDLGALAGDVGFLPSASWCGRVRGDLLNLTTELTGSRLGRGFVRPGGVLADAGPEVQARLLSGVKRAAADARGAVDLLWSTGSVRDRFTGTGALAREACEEMGLVGPAARACAVPRDVRRELPTGVYAQVPIEARLWPTGDVMARARVRWMEVERSAEFLKRLLGDLPPTPLNGEVGPLLPEAVAVSLVEGWRGEVCHVALTSAQGRFSAYKVVDPSFHNWAGLALAMRGQPISDFPLVNKSFNLSYCGHDL
jgi:Ni,Fe-hydrogenase III large subunit